MSDDIFSTLRFSGWNETAYRTTIDVLRAQKGDGKYLFGRHGFAVADFLELFLAQSELPKNAMAKPKEPNKMTAEEVEAKELITDLQALYKAKLGFVWKRKTPQTHRMEQKRIAEMMKSYGREKVIEAWKMFVMAGTKISEDKRYEYMFSNGDIASFARSINKLMAMTSSTQGIQSSAVPASFRGTSR